MLQVDDINIGAPQLEQEHWVRHACGFIGKVNVGVFCWRRNFALLGVEDIPRRLLVLGPSGRRLRCVSFLSC